jgi:hypothetical protein
VTFTATVTAVGITGTPTGSVTFTDGAASLGESALAGGTATLATGALSGGSHTITATYSGDARFASAYGTLVQSISPATTTIGLTATPTSATVGTPITLTATVGSGGAVPGGSVTFFDGASQLGAAPLAAGVASFVAASLGVGTHTIHAAYNATADFAASRSADVSVVIRNAPQTADAGAGTPPDTGAADSGTEPAGDAGPGGTPVVGVPISGVDAGGFGGVAINGGGGDNCGCRAVGGETSGGGVLALLAGFGLAFAGIARRRRPNG